VEFLTPDRKGANEKPGKTLESLRLGGFALKLKRKTAISDRAKDATIAPQNLRGWGSLQRGLREEACMTTQTAIIPIYNTRGDADAFLHYPYLFNRVGEWIGFVTPNREVYSVRGEFVGTVTDDPRIVSRRAKDDIRPRLEPPPHPRKFSLPARIPLAPLMPELSHSLVDVLLETPEKLHTLDTGELREDLD
jgi:hypothetical protein